MEANDTPAGKWNGDPANMLETGKTNKVGRFGWRAVTALYGRW